MQMRQLAIIIPFFQGDSFIEECLQSIVDSPPTLVTSFRIYLVDNNSEPSRHQALFASIKELQQVKTKAAIGFGRACNIGAYKAMEEGADVLLFLNQDTRLQADMLDQLLACAGKEQGLQVFSPMILEYDSDRAMEMVVQSYLSAHPNLQEDLKTGDLQERYALPTIGAACILLHQSVIQQIGLFDPVFYLYAEDYDFFRRLAEAEGQLFLVPTAKLHHMAGLHRSEEEFAKKRYLHYLKAQVIKSLRYEGRKQAMRKSLRWTYGVFRRQGLGASFGLLRHALRSLLWNRSSIEAKDTSSLQRRISDQLQQDLLA
ncbi:MAG: glycosyltransferase family 2 protein [Bacteroidota bacterium]